MAKKEQPKSDTVDSKAKVVVTDLEPPKITPTGLEGLVGKTIDERMADLLADHKKMGAR